MTDPKYANLSALQCLRKLNQMHYGSLLQTPFGSDYIHRKFVVEKKDHELKSRPVIGPSEVAQGIPRLRELQQSRGSGLCPE